MTAGWIVPGGSGSAVKFAAVSAASCQRGQSDPDSVPERRQQRGHVGGAGIDLGFWRGGAWSRDRSWPSVTGRWDFGQRFRSLPGCREQRCCVHKTATVLDKMPKSVQGKAKGMLHEMWQAPTKEKALSAYEHFLNSWQGSTPRRWSACTRTRRSCLLSMTSLRRTGCISKRPTRSSRPTRR